MHTCHLSQHGFTHFSSQVLKEYSFCADGVEVAWLSAIFSMLNRIGLVWQASRIVDNSDGKRIPMVTWRKFQDNVLKRASSSSRNCQVLVHWHTRPPLTPWWHDASLKTTCCNVESSSRRKCQILSHARPPLMRDASSKRTSQIQEKNTEESRMQ